MGASKDAVGRWAPLGAVLALVLFAYPLLLDIPLLDPDEGLHASIAQEMVERGDWVTPRLRGQPFLDKPILYFWAEAASLRLLGMNEAAVRLPGLFFGLFGAVTTGLVGGRLFGRRTGLLAALFYATTILPTALAQAAAHDVALVPWVNLALLLFWQSHHPARRGVQAAQLLALGLLLGLSVLTKGLVGVALVGVAYGSYLLVTRRLDRAACLRGAAALGLAALVALPWYLAMEVRNPGYLYYYIVERHLLGYATGSQLHGGEPWWYYLPILAGGGLPWTLYLPVAAWEGWTGRRTAATGRREGTVLLWCWLAGGTLLFSLASSKTVTYIWPVFPAIALLAAVAWERLLAGALSQRGRRLLGSIFCASSAAGPLALPIAMLVVRAKFEVHWASGAWAVGLLAAGASLAPLVLWRTGRYRATLASALLMLAAQFAVILTVIVPVVAVSESARDLARYVNRQGRLPQRLIVAEERIGSLIFYLDPALRAGLRHNQVQGLRLFDFDEVPVLIPGAVVALPEEELDKAAVYLQYAHAPYRRAGRYRVYEGAELQLRTVQHAPPPVLPAALPPDSRRCLHWVPRREARLAALLPTPTAEPY